ncbi:MAG: valine--tRNA ligase, partial [Kiritimatiellae bacterium]|nr:valine--tRNA ligase [Kiritimatiellia bacterium]
YVEKEFGTGIGKITPAHDPNDFLVGKRHNLAEINIMTDDGHMNELAGEKYVGMDRFECRKALVADLEAGGYLDHIEDYDNQVGHCYRCHEVVESRLSKQWFVKMAPLAAPAIEAVKNGSVRFVPERWSKIYFNWMENIQDWCISRQLWWGHRIPAYTCRKCGELVVGETAPGVCPKCGAHEFEQDPDVLDTWFSSWLWPFSTLGWPEKTADLAYYYPTADLVTAQDIIFFWVARMIMAGIHFMGQVPFRNIVIHGIVRDAQGRKMSKSLGNSLDPLELIDMYSADALRFSIALITSLDCDSKVSKEKFEIGRNFCTKIWNVARFLEMQGVKDCAYDRATLTADERHILAACDKAAEKLNALLEQYRIQDGALAVYDFIWTDLCDWYVEYAKDAPDKQRAFAVLNEVFFKALKLLHPYMPFITEEIAHQLGYLGGEESIMKAEYPKASGQADEETYRFVNLKREAITALRALRAEYKVPPGTFVKVTIATADDKVAGEIASLKKAMRAESVELVAAGAELAMPSKLTGLGTVYLSLEGLVDKAAEAKRIQGEIAKVAGFIKSGEAKLANRQFVDHAPAAIVDEARRKLAENQDKLVQLEKLLKLFA